jgi:hypothetical protein
METGVTPEPRDWEATAERLVFLPDSGGSHRRLSTTACSSVRQARPNIVGSGTVAAATPRPTRATTAVEAAAKIYISAGD